MKNTIEIEIMDDGSVSIKTGEFSDSVHMGADELLKDFESLLAGTVERKRNPKKHNHLKENAFQH